MTIDRSEGYDGIATVFMANRSAIGATLVQSWAREHLPPLCSVVDVGCGSGVPIALALIEAGFKVYGIDASPRLIAAFQRRFPAMPATCEAAQGSGFFQRTFHGAVSIGLLFLLQPDDQRRVLSRVAAALRPGGRFLFTAPADACEWRDVLTGRPSISLGKQAYQAHLEAAGLRLMDCHQDRAATTISTRQNHWQASSLPCERPSLAQSWAGAAHYRSISAPRSARGGKPGVYAKLIRYPCASIPRRLRWERTDFT